ncbi:MAG: M56 family metallopeptidase, partial [Candidatus Aminicenantaceae bacterium]
MEFLTEIKGLDLISEFFIKSSVILIFTFMLVFLFRNKSASLRHFLLSVSLISLLLFPFLSTLTKGWETGLLPTWNTGEGRSQISQRWDQDRRKTIPLNSINPSLADKQLQALKLEKNGRFNFFLSKYSISKGFFGLVLVAIWSAGLVVLLSRIFIGLYGAHRLTRQGKEISDSSWRQLLNHFLEAISIKRNISLFSHKNVNIPLTWGVIKPVVILPTESRNWTQDQRSSALFHELSHIKRSDFLIKILARCSVALYWFNPLSWFAFRMMKKEQEKACDELVLKTGVKPSTYAVNLLSIKKAGQFHWNPPTAALGAVGKSQLNERLVAILKQQLKPKETNMKTKIMLSSLIIMTIAFIGLARPAQSEAFTDKIFSQEKQVKKMTKKTEKKEAEDKKDKKLTFIS